MSALEIIIGILVIIVSLVIIAAVLLQQGHRAGVGAVTGAADTFLSKNKARTFDAVLARWTKYVAILFFVLAIVANIIALRG